MSYATTTTLGLIFAMLAILNASLMAWLWRFPLDGHGVSTAPKVWRRAHRLIGYSFVILYVAMLVVMLPRLGSYLEFTSASWLHLAAAIGLAPLIVFKVLVVRDVVPLGAKLPIIGGTLLAATIFSVGTALLYALPLSLMPPREAKDIVLRRCTQCHGASRFMDEHRSFEDWMEVGEEMAEKAQKAGRPLTMDEAELASRYLATLRGTDEKDDDGGKRRRRR